VPLLVPCLKPDRLGNMALQHATAIRTTDVHLVHLDHTATTVLTVFLENPAMQVFLDCPETIRAFR